MQGCKSVDNDGFYVAQKRRRTNVKDKKLRNIMSEVVITRHESKPYIINGGICCVILETCTASRPGDYEYSTSKKKFGSNTDCTKERPKFAKISARDLQLHESVFQLVSLSLHLPTNPFTNSEGQNPLLNYIKFAYLLIMRLKIAKGPVGVETLQIGFCAKP